MKASLRRAGLLGLCLLAASARAEDAAAPQVVAEGSKVSIEYTLKLDDGSTADTNVGQPPVVYEQGKGQMLPALEKQLVGLKVNDSRKFDVSAENGFGPVDPAAFKTVPATQIPEEARVAGTVLVAEDANGERHQVRVHEVKGEEVVVDMNHPLAGKTLHFDVKILAIQAPGADAPDAAAPPAP